MILDENNDGGEVSSFGFMAIGQSQAGKDLKHGKCSRCGGNQNRPVRLISPERNVATIPGTRHRYL